MSDEKPAHIHIGEKYDTLLIEDSPLRGHAFIQCSFNHANISPKQDLYGVTLYGCQCHYLEAPDVKFNHVSAQDCDFRHSNFKGAVFYQTRLNKCDFSWANFTGADLARCHSEGSNFNLSHLQKVAKINVWDRDQIAELIHCQAKGDVEVLMIAALVKNSMEFCWREWKTIARFPQYKRVAEVIYKILHQYSFLNLNDGIVGGV